jgi:hypothetical protein
VYLRNANTALNNAKSIPGIIEAMTPNGFGEERLEEGLALWSKTNDLFAVRHRERGEQYESGEAFHEIFEKARRVNQLAVKCARRVFKKNPHAWEELQLHGPRSVVFPEWYKQSSTFYTNVLAKPQYISELGYFGYTEAKVREERALTEEVMAANNLHIQQIGESQEATKLRNATFKEFEDWMINFYTVAKHALSDKPQWLEKLGITQA